MVGKEDDSLKLDNVICRTPSRNAPNLELVKQEIMDMVNRPDAEQVTEKVKINRLFHRELIVSRMNEIEELEKRWNCKITFPSTEQASDVVLVSGPEFQVPQATYEFLVSILVFFRNSTSANCSRGWFPKVMRSPSMLRLTSRNTFNRLNFGPRWWPR
jgi:hypothetical protein